MTKGDHVPEEEMDPRFVAGLDLIRRTGALQVQVRWSDDEEPHVWFVTARHNFGPDRHPRPEGEPGTVHWSVAAALHPLGAVFALLEELVDGSFCVHCQRPTGVTDEVEGMPLDQVFCWYVFDPELKTYRRGCEGDS